MERVLKQLIERLTRAYEERLVSVVLYGSAAVGDHHGRYSDINIFCILTAVTTRELRESEELFKWWRELGNPAPLLMSEGEVRAAADSFPIEFHDIRERHRLLHGADIVSSIEWDDRFYRAHVEHELRSKLLRLRQKAAGVLTDQRLLLRLMADSVSTFCVLTRHALRLRGVDAAWHKREVMEQAGEKLGIDPQPFRLLIDLREEKIKPRELDAAALLESYLKEIHAVIESVDRLKD